MKKILAILMTFCLALSLVACGSSPKTTADTSSNAGDTASNYTIGFFVKDTTNSFWRYVVNGAQIRAEERGIKLVEYTPTEASNVEEQISLIEDAIEAGVDAICIVAVDSDAVQSALKQALDAGIPVITFNTRVPLEGISTFCGVENYEGYEKVAEQVFADINHEGDVVIIEGVVSAMANKDRVEACEDTAAKYDGINIISSQIGNNDRAMAMSVMENLLQTYPKIDVVLAHNDNTAIGALQAVQEAGREGEIKIVGFDGTVEGIESVLTDGILYSLDQSPYQQGAYAVQAAIDVLDGKTVEANIATGGTLITKENAQSILDEFYSTE